MPLSNLTNGIPKRSLPTRESTEEVSSLNGTGIKRDVIVIGASAGGVQALQRLFAGLPPTLPAIVGVVLHRGPMPSALEMVLGRRSSLPVIEPKHDQGLRKGRIYLAPADHHIRFHAGRVEVLRGPKEHSTRPAVDPLFRSAAEAYGDRVAGVLLTGCGEDGVSGMIAITEAKGLSLVQDPQEADMPYMPLSAIRYDHVQGVYPIDELGLVLGALARGESVGRHPVPRAAMSLRG